MIAIPQPHPMTVAAYLDWEPHQELRYEFVNGDVVAMTGGSLPHNDIAVNLLAALRPAVRVQDCRINIADAKVKVSASIYRYPDLVVSCDADDLAAIDAIQAPRLIVEVLSPATEAVDRGEKLQQYRQLPSLQEYVLISSTEVNVEIYRRGQGRLWLYAAYQAGEELTLESIGVTLTVALLYEAVSLPEKP